jgi:twinkle protein
MGTFIRHIPCQNCGSSDANAFYEDDSTYCYVCLTYGGPSKDTDRNVVDQTSRPTTRRLLSGSYVDIPKRALKEETCRKFGYQCGEDETGEPIQIANYCDASGRVVAQKIRSAGKQFRWVGDRSQALPLYGQHLWANGKAIVICEGEVDALSIAQAFSLKWAVVSLPDGAQSALKAIKQAYDYLCQYERIILCLDNDEPGKAATQKIAEILPVGRVYVMSLARKDGNDVLVNDGAAPITNAFWNATEWRPDGILSGNQFTKDQLRKAMISGYSLPWPTLTYKLGGIFEGQLTLLTAGSGIGKSTIAREVGYWLHQHHGLTIGNIFLEEAITTTAQAYVALDNNVRLRSLREDPSILSDDQWEISLSRVLSERMYFYDHFGSLESERLLSKIRYMRQVLKVNFVILDHISIVISGQQSSSEGERRDIDVLLTKLRSLIQETGLGVIAIVHLRQPDGKPHEEGGRVTLRDLRGSGSLKQLSDVVWALERDQQSDKPNQSLIRILKDRNDGQLGPADTVEYNVQGRLVPVASGVGL